MNTTRMPHFIFISGMEKCGSTAVAGWLLKHGVAQNIVPRVKEPYIYAQPGAQPFIPPPESGIPWLDASVGYAHNPSAIARIPEHGTKIVLCLRNPFDRSWSSYRMKKIAALRSETAIELLGDYHQTASGQRPHIDKHTAYSEIKKLFMRHFPRRASSCVEKYFDAEMNHIEKTSFGERVEYETILLSSRQKYPFLSILQSSFYFTSIRNFLEKFQPEDIILVSARILESPDKRMHFLSRLTGTPRLLPEIPFGFSSKDLPFEEPPPDFAAAQWNLLRRMFTYDMMQLKKTLTDNNVDQSLLDWAELMKNLEPAPSFP